jgi:hypothetical protein
MSPADNDPSWRTFAVAVARMLASPDTEDRADALRPIDLSNLIDDIATILRSYDDAVKAVRDAATERAKLIARIEATERREGCVTILGSRNDGWRAFITDPVDNGHWFASACYDSRDTAAATAAHWAICNDVKLVPRRDGLA